MTGGDHVDDSSTAPGFSAVLDVYRQQQVGGGSVGFGDRIGVIVIDLQHLYTRGRASTGLDVVERTSTLLDAARAAGVPIAFARMGYDDDFQPGHDVWTMKCPLLGRRPDEPLHTKRVPSALFDPDLREHFRASGVDTLVVAGTSTSGCVRATVVDGVSHGFRMVVARECVADRSAPSEEAALFDISTKYGDVVALEAVLVELAHRDAGSARREVSP